MGDSIKSLEDLEDNSDVSKSSDQDTKNENTDEWLDLLGTGHIKKRVITPGKDDSRPQRGDICIIDIIGRLEDGNTFEELKGVEVCVGDADVIQGIDYALPLMNLSETSEIIITSRFGFGEIGNKDGVPPGATVIYTVTICEIKEIYPDTEVSASEKLTIGVRKKERGNWWFERKEYQLAIQCYRKALTFLDADSEDEAVKEVRLKTFNNLTIAQMNIEAFEAALTSVNEVLLSEPTNIKAVYRKVKILKAKGELDEAIKIAKEGLKIKPDSPAFQETLNSLLETKKKSISAQKVLYRKMFKNTESENKNNKATKLTLVWKWFGIFTIAVGVISAVAIKYRT